MQRHTKNIFIENFFFLVHGKDEGVCVRGGQC